MALVAKSWHAFWLAMPYFQLPALHQVHFLVIGQSPDDEDEELVLLAAPMRWPPRHVACVAHDVLRCDEAVW